MKTGRTIALALVVALLASACSRSGFSYVEQQDEGIFVKVPDEWTVFETTEIEPPAVLLADILLQPIGGRIESWQVVIDAGPNPTASNIHNSLYEFPIGIAEVQPIDPAIRDLFNTTSMRALSTGFEVDPVTEANDGNTEFVIELDQDIVQDQLRGNRLRFKRMVEGGIVVVDSLVLTDGANSRWYRLSLTCEEKCFLANAAVINDIMTSFTVER